MAIRMTIRMTITIGQHFPLSLKVLRLQDSAKLIRHPAVVARPARGKHVHQDIALALCANPEVAQQLIDILCTK